MIYRSLKCKNPCKTGIFLIGIAGTRTLNQRIVSQRKLDECQDGQRDFESTGPATGPRYSTGPAAGPDDVPPVDPELAKLVDVWPMLAEPLKRAILALIETAYR